MIGRTMASVKYVSSNNNNNNNNNALVNAYTSRIRQINK
jgi:hypothetical protein